MRVKPIIFKSSQSLKWTGLLIFWILSFLTLIIVSPNNELNKFYNHTVSQGPEFRPLKNEIRDLTYTKRDPKENSRPIYSIHFNSLLAENNELGIFKTALYKVVKIRDLQLSFYEYKISHIPKGTRISLQAIMKIAEKRINPMDGWGTNIDLSNVSEIIVNNFDYKVFYKDNLSLAVQSKRAFASYKQANVVLRGHVTITTADGSTLESNYVMWDLEKQRFKVNGIYVLNHNGIRKKGKDICVDTQLNLTKAQQAKLKQKETEKCFAKL